MDSSTKFTERWVFQAEKSNEKCVSTTLHYGGTDAFGTFKSIEIIYTYAFGIEKLNKDSYIAFCTFLEYPIHSSHKKTSKFPRNANNCCSLIFDWLKTVTYIYDFE